jgi:hypothetical protein
VLSNICCDQDAKMKLYQARPTLPTQYWVRHMQCVLGTSICLELLTSRHCTPLAYGELFSMSVEAVELNILVSVTELLGRLVHWAGRVSALVDSSLAFCQATGHEATDYSCAA